MIVKALVSAALALVSVPAIPQQTVTPVTVPVDQIARAKFPNEDGAVVDALAALNKMVNSSITYETDKAHYGYDDFWTVPVDSKGDCEDYVLGKLFVLDQIDFPIVSHAKVVTVLIVAGKQVVGGHAILAILMPHGSVAYLDMAGEPMTRAELVAKGYQFFDWKA